MEPPTKRSDAQWAEDRSRELRSAYEAGNKNALWKMIVVCALSKSADGYVASGELNSWNELFGKPRLKSRSVLRGWHLRHEVWANIVDSGNEEQRAWKGHLDPQSVLTFAQAAMLYGGLCKR